MNMKDGRLAVFLLLFSRNVIIFVNMKLSRLIICCAFIVLTAISCRHVAPIVADPASEYIDSYSVDASFNATRVSIELGFKSQCEWAVRFWEADSDRSASVMTSYFSSSENNIVVLKFLKPGTVYDYEIVLNDGELSSRLNSFKTIALPDDLPSFNVEQSLEGDWLDGYFLHADIDSGYVTLCDYSGEIVWYYKAQGGARVCTFDPVRGWFAILVGYRHTEPVDHFRLCEEIRVVDINGNTVFSRLSDQNFVEYAHHEFKITPDGDMLILACYLKDYDGFDCWGESINRVDINGNKLFCWNNFNEINPDKDPWFVYDNVEMDYLHGNSIDIDDNGDYYISFNYLSEVWKVDGKTGDVIYRFGEHGNLSMVDNPDLKGKTVLSPLDFPITSIHAVTLFGPDRFLIYNNGEFRQQSAVMSVSVDPVSMTAKYEMLTDLPEDVYCANRSNAQMLPNGNLLVGCATRYKSVIITPDGEVVRVISRDRSKAGISYRSYWYALDSPAFQQ